MLAYLFHHWRRPSVDVDDYDARLRRFHRALADAPPSGFLRSICVAHRGAPWSNAGGDAYEDWYLLSDSAALDPLNEAAITASRQLPHDDAAAAASGGTAGLYRARLGALSIAPEFAYWFAKPTGMSYHQLYDAMRPFTGDAAGLLWGRQMTLGPAREFCLQTRTPYALPGPLEPIALSYRRIWPEG